MAEREREGDPGLLTGVKGAARDMRGEMTAKNADERMRKAIREKPLLKHLLDMRVVLRAVAFAVVIALITWLLISGKLAGLLLIVCFFGAWFILATRQYERRRGSEPAEIKAPS